MASYGKFDKISALAMLELNNGNVLRTAKELNLGRDTLLRWREQMKNDLKLLEQVRIARENFGDIEQLTAFKAQAELSRRLDESPEEIRDSDLIRAKDSAFQNARLSRNEPTSITQHQYTPEQSALEFFKILLGKGLPFDEAIAALRQASLEPLVSNYTRDIVADRIEANPKLLTEGQVT